MKIHCRSCIHVRVEGNRRQREVKKGQSSRVCNFYFNMNQGILSFPADLSQSSKHGWKYNCYHDFDSCPFLYYFILQNLPTMAPHHMNLFFKKSCEMDSGWLPLKSNVTENYHLSFCKTFLGGSRLGSETLDLFIRNVS